MVLLLAQTALLVLLSFGVGAAVAVLVMRRVLPDAGSVQEVGGTGPGASTAAGTDDGGAQQ